MIMMQSKVGKILLTIILASGDVLTELDALVLSVPKVLNCILVGKL